MAYKIKTKKAKEKNSFVVENKKNLFLKERGVENPYEVWKTPDGSWEWRVLKKWQIEDDKPYARWLCAVKSPFTYGKYDIGDVYVKDIKSFAVKEGEHYEAPSIPFSVEGRKELNEKIFERRQKSYNEIKDLRVGDYIKEKNGKLTRVTYIHKFSDTPKKEYEVQTGGNSGSYYFGEKGGIDYSSGLDSGYKYGELEATNKTKEGDVWFFDQDVAGAGRGIDKTMKFKIWKVK